MPRWPGLIQDKSMRTEACCHLMLSAAGWEAHLVLYSSPRGACGHLTNSFLAFDAF